jgi:hypothetical protein
MIVVQILVVVAMVSVIGLLLYSAGKVLQDYGDRRDDDY